jgi:hypothetical protein
LEELPSDAGWLEHSGTPSAAYATPRSPISHFASSAAAGYVAERFDASLLSFTFYAILLLFDYLVLPFSSGWLLYRLAALAFSRLVPH